MAEVRYQRLTRTHPRARFGIISASRSSLWLGKDHLLCIDTNAFTEKYKRFYLRDIQAIILQTTSFRLVLNLVFGGVAMLFGLIAFVGSSEPIVLGIFGSLAGLFLLAMAANHAAGPTCVCFLRTAVQTEELPSLNRLRRARKVLNRLRPLIAQAQGQLAPEEIPARLQQWLAEKELRVISPPSGLGYVVDDPNAPPKIFP
jgi:hypothetical protein